MGIKAQEELERIHEMDTWTSYTAIEDRFKTSIVTRVPNGYVLTTYYHKIDESPMAISELFIPLSLGALEELHSEIFDSIGLELQEKEAVRAQTKAFNLEVIARLDRMRRVLEHL